MNISSAGNVEIPAYLTLQNKGYVIGVGKNEAGEQIWIAEKDGNQFSAEGLIELLGVVSVFEVRGDAWRATDSEFDDFIKRYNFNL
jgi:hypothetical protein